MLKSKDPSNNVPSNNEKDESSGGGTTAAAADSTAVDGGEDNDKTAAAAATGTWEERTFDLVVKSPPKASFMRLMHRMTKPFLNEVILLLYCVSPVRTRKGEKYDYFIEIILSVIAIFKF